MNLSFVKYLRMNNEIIVLFNQYSIWHTFLGITASVSNQHKFIVLNLMQYFFLLRNTVNYVITYTPRILL